MAGVAGFQHVECVLCKRARASHRGEHVLPQWYLRRELVGPGPYSWEAGGRPILDRRGVPILLDEQQRTQLPVCEVCNGQLERNFERPAKDILSAWFDSDGTLALSAEETRNVTRWLIKTLLLLAHPQARLAHPGLDRVAQTHRWSSALPAEYYAWMLTSELSPADPPFGLSPWVFRRDLNDSSRGPHRRGIYLPTVADGAVSIEFRVQQIVFHGMNVSLVYHPGWDIEHPLEVEGRAVRLWPVDQPTQTNLGRLLVVPPAEEVTWVSGSRTVLTPGSLGSTGLAPIREGLGFEWMIAAGVTHFSA